LEKDDGSVNSRFADDEEWRIARRFALARDGYSCQGCGHSTKSELDVHHRMPRYIRVDHGPQNLVTMCDACHAGKHLNLQLGLADVMIRRWTLRIAKLIDWRRDLPKDTGAITEALRVLGKRDLRTGQLEIILAILRGEDVLVVRPTGSGKSVCFQVPTLLRPGTALVIEPLKALMKDQVKGLHRRCVPATFINGDLSPTERQLRYLHLERSTWKFLYLAPERFDGSVVVDRSEQARLRAFRPNFLVIDEAHSIVQYGRGFRPSYAQLGVIRDRVGNPQVLAFTATASPRTRSEILESISAKDATVIVESSDRPNITLARIEMSKKNAKRFEVIRRLIGSVHRGRTIIFVPTVKEGEIVQRGLQAEGLNIDFFYSGAQTAAWRDNLQGQFDGRIEPNVRTIIATSAFGMGLDIPDIRLVVHWQHPFSVEEYLQGFGRAGRDGLLSLAVLFTDSKEDSGLLRFMLERQEGGDPDERRRELAVIEGIVGDKRSCFRSALSAELGDAEKTRASLAVRIAKWALEKRSKTQRNPLCCEVCNPHLVKDVMCGGTAILSRP